MKLRKQTLGIIIALLVLSLGGLVALQYVLLGDAIRQKQETFRQNVYTAMNAVAGRVEQHETAGKVFKVMVSTESGDPSVVHVNVDTMIQRKILNDSIVMVSSMPAEPQVWLRKDTLHYTLDKKQHVTLRVYDAAGTEDTVLVDTFKNAGVYALCLNDPKYASGEFFYKILTDNGSYAMHVDNGNSSGVLGESKFFEHRKQMVGKVIENLTGAEREPLEQRIPPGTLNSYIQLSLAEAGITIPYAYGVSGEKNDSLEIVQPASYSHELLNSQFKSNLFPGDFLSNGNRLFLYFPDQNVYLFKQIGWEIALTFILTLVIVFCFSYTIYTIIKQKDFAVRLVEFINNMTHEFKTPISTISVATETIMRQDVIEQKEKVLRYGAVIRDENRRMKEQVDKILQMAVLEEGDLDLKLVPVDLHELIEQAVKNFTLTVESKQGKIEAKLDAVSFIINADQVHIANIIHNVLDNAIKYSPEAPRILIATQNDADRLIVRVEDHGIGIGKDELSKVFDKYYRVPTGNLHDVKGFGLGLSYVKLMMTAHGGNAQIASEPGKGTTVTLTFLLPIEMIG